MPPHIDRLLRPVRQLHIKKIRLICQPVRHIQNLLHTVNKGIPFMPHANQQNFSAYAAQPVITTARCTGRIVILLTHHIFCRVLSKSCHTVSGMQRAHHPRTLSEQICQKPHTGLLCIRVKNRIAFAHLPPGMGRQKQKSLRKIFHPGIQHRVRTALHFSNRLHGGMNEHSVCGL